MPPLVGIARYLWWLTDQAALGGISAVLLLAAILFLVLAVRKNRAAALALPLPLLPAAPLLLATAGWVFPTGPDRTAPWVAYAALACLVVWVIAFAASLFVAPRARAFIAVAALLSAFPMLVCAALADMSGTGDWL